jgi:hypothetical protein
VAALAAAALPQLQESVAAQKLEQLSLSPLP